ncbi:MAG: PH domain-containing protein [Candidatus Lokiarchaeota archaeon]|nr:PH domain-containing protein [Candidatus Lokiarchaeota archaeon]
MSEEKNSYEGSISSSYKNKELLKNTILLGIIATAGAFFIWWIMLMIFTDGLEEIIMFPIEVTYLIFIIAYSVFITIIVITYLYNVAYVKNFSYKISEDHIVIKHGVFTKIVATIPYSRIQNINIVNGVFDRIFKIFTVKIETAGSSAAAASAQKGIAKPEGYIPGLKDARIIEKKIKEMMTKYSAVPSGLEDKIFKPEELAFDNFISYILSKMREGEKLKTSITELREKANFSAADLAEKVGVPLQTINYLAEGRYNPSLALAYKIAQVLNCKIEDLFKLV